MTKPRTQLKYQWVENEIRQLARTLPIGAKLPAERDLAISLKCNFLTVRKAFLQLVDDGTVVRRVGSGTFIARHQSSEDSGTGEKRRMGILVYQGSNTYAYRVLQAIAHEALEQKVDLSSGWIEDFGDKALSLAEEFKGDGCVALTLPWIPPGLPHEKLTEVRAFLQRCPLPVSIPTLIPGFERNCFAEAGIFGVTSIIEELCDYYRLFGAERLAFIGPNSSSDVILQKRLASFICYTSRANLPSPCGLVLPNVGAMDQLAERWKAYRGDLAIVSYDDEHALRLITAMHKSGLSAPDDYRIIGFNDTEASRYSDPPLSTVHQHYDYIAHWLLKSALALSRGEVMQSSKPARLQMLVRSTCGGRGKIDESLCSHFEDLDITEENSGHTEETMLATANGANQR